MDHEDARVSSDHIRQWMMDNRAVMEDVAANDPDRLRPFMARSLDNAQAYLKWCADEIDLLNARLSERDG